MHANCTRCQRESRGGDWGKGGGAPSTSSSDTSFSKVKDESARVSVYRFGDGLTDSTAVSDSFCCQNAKGQPCTGESLASVCTDRCGPQP